MLLICEAKQKLAWKTHPPPHPAPLLSISPLKLALKGSNDFIQILAAQTGTLCRLRGTTIFFPGEKGLGIQNGMG